jgi:glycolate oxidase
MALPKNVYREFEDIVGPENITDDLMILETYAVFPMSAMGPLPKDRFMPRPAAAIVPGSTEEVQKIVKLCARRGLKYKASSTAYAGFGAVSSEENLFLDMRRMNRLLEIDSKNMYAVVEPYVNFAQLQGEAMKYGLSCHIIGAGSNASALASTTSVHGTSTQNISMGYGGRNALGVEWVLPSGEILRTGSMGFGAGSFFSGDGPGPSLRGIMRGHAGALGGMGVFTKCAIHLHPWYGPSKIELENRSPDYEMEVPENFEYHMIEWPDWNKLADAYYKIAAANIAFAMHKTGGPGSAGPVVVGNNNEYYEKWEELKGLPWVSFAILTAAATPEEHDYQVKTLNKILEDTEGKILPLGETALWKKRDTINMIKSCFIPRLAFRPAGSFACPLQGSESIDHMAFGLSFDDEFRRKYDEKSLLLNDGNNGMWGVAFEGGHMALFECGHMYSPIDADSFKAGKQMLVEGEEIALKAPFSIGWGLMMNFKVEKLGKYFCNQQNWQRKIKMVFDPYYTADASGYIEPEEPRQGETKKNTLSW